MILKSVHAAYKKLLSPLMGNRCRFHPTCSDYALQAIEAHGIIFGSWLALIRLAKCNPFFEGGFDEVPKEFSLSKKMCVNDCSKHGR